MSYFTTIFYFVFFFFNNIETTIMIIRTTIDAIPATGNSSGFAKAFVHIAIFLMKIEMAYPVVPAPIMAKTALNHLGKTSVKKIAVTKQINAMKTHITKCIV